MEPSRHERFLVYMLRIIAGVLLLAFATVFLPTPWMAATHRWLGLGDFPASPLVEYLTRSASLLYGFHGVLVAVTSTNVRRLRPMVLYIGWMNITFGIAMTGVDLYAGLPLMWTLGEGPPILGGGVLILYLVRHVPNG